MVGDRPGGLKRTRSGSPQPPSRNEVEHQGERPDPLGFGPDMLRDCRLAAACQLVSVMRTDRAMLNRLSTGGRTLAAQRPPRREIRTWVPLGDGEVCINLKSGGLRESDGQPMRCTSDESTLLKCFVDARGSAVPCERIKASVGPQWGSAIAGVRKLLPPGAVVKMGDAYQLRLPSSALGEPSRTAAPFTLWHEQCAVQRGGDQRPVLLDRAEYTVFATMLDRRGETIRAGDLDDAIRHLTPFPRAAIDAMCDKIGRTYFKNASGRRCLL